MAGDWRDLVSSRVGLVTDLSPQVRDASDPVPPYLYTATMSHFDFRKSDKKDRLAAGKGWTEEGAILSALGEAVERYSAYHWDPRRTFLAKWEKVCDAAISPADCILYSEDQYKLPERPYRPFDVGRDVAWICGVELPHGREVALPASLVYLVHPIPRIEDFFAPATSNGLAAGPTLQAAVLGGLYELIERDALLITWMNRLPAIEIEMPEDGSPAAAIIRHYSHFGVRLRAFLMRTDQPAAVVMAVASETDPARPARLIGMGCDLNPQVALNKAIFEYCQARPSESRRYAQNPPQGRLTSYEQVKTLEDHPAFLCMPENSWEFDFLSIGGERRKLDDLPNPSRGTVEADLETCVAALSATGHRVAYVDLTTPDVAYAGMRAVRTIAAGLQPIHFGFGEERFGGGRILQAAKLLGFAEAARGVNDLNPCPHPLA